MRAEVIQQVVALKQNKNVLSGAIVVVIWLLITYMLYPHPTSYVAVAGVSVSKAPEQKLSPTVAPKPISSLAYDHSAKSTSTVTPTNTPGTSQTQQNSVTTSSSNTASDNNSGSSDNTNDESSSQPTPSVTVSSAPPIPSTTAAPTPTIFIQTPTLLPSPTTAAGGNNPTVTSSPGNTQITLQGNL